MQVQSQDQSFSQEGASHILALEDVTKTFPGVTALSEVLLKLYPGEVTALVGENGAGKSTVVKILTGIYKADAGKILIDGQPVQFPTAQAAADAAALGAYGIDLNFGCPAKRVNNHDGGAALGLF